MNDVNNLHNLVMCMRLNALLAHMRDEFDLENEDLLKGAFITFQAIPDHEWTYVAALYLASEGRWSVTPEEMEDIRQPVQEFFTRAEKFVHDSINPNGDMDDEKLEEAMNIFLMKEEDVLARTGLFTKRETQTH